MAVRQRDFEETGRDYLIVCFRKSAGTARSRRCNLRKRGLGAGATSKLNRGFLPEQKSPIFRICRYRCPACQMAWNAIPRFPPAKNHGFPFSGLVSSTPSISLLSASSSDCSISYIPAPIAPPLLRLGVNTCFIPSFASYPLCAAHSSCGAISLVNTIVGFFETTLSTSDASFSGGSCRFSFRSEGVSPGLSSVRKFPEAFLSAELVIKYSYPTPRKCAR